MNNSLSGWLKTPYIIIGVLVLLALWGFSSYNGLMTKSLAVDTQWAQVESQYQRRVDLIPNLVNSVKGAMSQEQKVFGDIATARENYAGAKTPDEKVAASGAFDSAFGRLLAIMENYPQLKSIDTVQSLMAEVSGTENRIAVERMRYNDVVLTYNTQVQTFPGLIFAGLFGFKPHALFASQTGADKAPVVNFQ